MLHILIAPARTSCSERLCGGCARLVEIREGAIEGMLLLYKQNISSRLGGYVRSVPRNPSRASIAHDIPEWDKSCWRHRLLCTALHSPTRIALACTQLTNNGDINFVRLGALVGQIGQLENYLLAAKCQSENRDKRRREESERQKDLDRLGRMQHAHEMERSAHRGQVDAQHADPAVFAHGSGEAQVVGRAGRALAKLTKSSSMELKQDAAVPNAETSKRPRELIANGCNDPNIPSDVQTELSCKESGPAAKRSRDNGQVGQEGDHRTIVSNSRSNHCEQEEQELDKGSISISDEHQSIPSSVLLQDGAEEEELDGGSLTADPGSNTFDSISASGQPKPQNARPTHSAETSGTVLVANSAKAVPFAAELEAAVECAGRMAAGEDLVRYGEPGWRERYYRHKLGFEPTDDDKRRAQPHSSHTSG